ncbi:hypothetical protein SteCoe_15382 [Stentor coeruleus]|uniref:Uncharacterized protein n=1 Tax=Stentor coeruleus TaxID=5963 RepID=A0A1R2C3Z6_9CILI|nr:hypothetical protein SteCoe_15382 [Stentor coeruleus]
MTSSEDSSLNCTKCFTSNNREYSCSDETIGNNTSCSRSSSQPSDSQIIILIVIPIGCVILFCAICIYLAYRRKRSMSFSDQDSDNWTRVSSPRPMSIQSLEEEINPNIEVNILDNTMMTNIAMSNTDREIIKSYGNPEIKDDNSSEIHDIIVEENKEGDFSFGK